MKPELLSPAGSPEKLKYAFAYGADAVYAGIPRFSLRARQNEFKDATMVEGIEYAHRLGKKVYVTANILPPNRKIESFRKSLAFYAEAGADGFIMADPGMIRFARRELPHIPVHLSVQTNTVNWVSARFWHEDLGVRRIILSRELSLTEMAGIHDKVPGVELEAFVHGSICIAYSGRCLLSNYFNHRDANQGTCTNSCRWEYNVYEEGNAAEAPGPARRLEGNYFIEEVQRPGELLPVDEDEHGTYIMNSKDLRALEFLQDLLEAGVVSFKIEGRNKSIYYLSLVTKTYRRALDDLGQSRPPPPGLLGELEKTANRGFTSAFLSNNPREVRERFDSPREEAPPRIYAGQVLGQRGEGWMEVEIKNRIEVGDRVEYISPHQQYVFRIPAMEDRTGTAISTAHGGNGTVWIPAGGAVEPYALLSRIQPRAGSPVKE